MFETVAVVLVSLVVAALCALSGYGYALLLTDDDE